MNFSDSERIRGVLEKAGFSFSESEEKSDIVVVNSCSVRLSSENKAISYIKSQRKKSKEKILVLTGCVGKNYTENELRKKIPELNLSIPISEINILPDILRSLKSDEFSRIDDLTLKSSYFSIMPSYGSKFRAYVPIMTGCDNFCSYCIVPISRGREESRPFLEIVSEVKSLVEKGYKEIILLGQNVNSYGQKSGGKFLDLESARKKGVLPEDVFSKFGEKKDFQNFSKSGKIFSELVRRILAEINQFFWLRFISPNPDNFSDDLIEIAKNDERVVRLFHIPLQSGSNRILKLMKRNYTKENYINLIQKIRSKIPEMEFTTDIIVGFPTESEEDFGETLELVRLVQFSNSFTAKFSPRKGTIAFEMVDDVPSKVKKERENIISKEIERITFEKSEKLVLRSKDKNERFKVLIENNEGEFFSGITFENKRVFLKKNDGINLSTGKFYDVRLIKSVGWGFVGEI